MARKLPHMPEMLPPEESAARPDQPPQAAGPALPEPNAPQMTVFAAPDGSVRVEARMQNGTLWMSQKLMAELYGVTPANISQHLKHLFAEGELTPEATVKDYLIVATNGKSYKTRHYSLEVILHVGYRVRSAIGTLFRQWATQRLQEYMVQGYTMNDNQLKYGDEYEDHFRVLLERIRDIRSTEQVFYRQVRKVISISSVDYERRKNEEEVRNFFAHLQDCLLYAVTGHTAAEIKCFRAEATAPHMGLTSFRGPVLRVADTDVAKNYLDTEELDNLNRLVTLFLEHAELRAKTHHDMTLADWMQQARHFLAFQERPMLQGYGTRRAEQAKAHVREQLKLYRQRMALEEKAQDDRRDAEDEARLAARQAAHSLAQGKD